MGALQGARDNKVWQEEGQEQDCADRETRTLQSVSQVAPERLKCGHPEPQRAVSVKQTQDFIVCKTGKERM